MIIYSRPAPESANKARRDRIMRKAFAEEFGDGIHTQELWDATMHEANKPIRETPPCTKEFYARMRRSGALR